MLTQQGTCMINPQGQDGRRKTKDLATWAWMELLGQVDLGSAYPNLVNLVIRPS